ncbi:MAG: winged helix-turn-helix domain-containing protein, partial [Acidobacteriota bacterium]|nr:winged helix-turn-helix domain-containing protein [Acidobacteriota bacterium]
MEFFASKMPRAYSNDLRQKVLEAHAAGKGSMRELAESFGVSLGWVEKISRQRRQSGQMERVEQRHGPLSRVTEAIEASLREQVRRVPDRTLVELQQALRDAHGIELSITQLWRVLQRMGLPLKKSRSMPKRQDTAEGRRRRKSGGTRSLRSQQR